MPDEPTLESGNQPEGTQEQPSPVVQEAGGDQQPSTSSGANIRDTVAEVLKDLGIGKDFAETMRRQAQGEKDRGVAANTKEISELRKTIEQYVKLKEGGVNHNEAVWRMELDEKLSRLETPQQQQPQAPAPVQGNGQRPQWWEVSRDTMLVEAGVSANDPDVVSLTQQGRTYKSYGEYLDALSQVIARKKMPTGTAGALNMGGRGTQSAPAANSEAALKAEYDKRKAELKPGQMQEMIRLRNEYRQKGLKV